MTQPVQPAPTPGTWQIQVPQPNVVVIVVHACTGPYFAFLGADEAVNIGEQIVNAGRQAKGGLIVPAPGFQLPPPNGSNGGRP
jgi:hypothetical protein